MSPPAAHPAQGPLACRSFASSTCCCVRRRRWEAGAGGKHSGRHEVTRHAQSGTPQGAGTGSWQRGRGVPAGLQSGLGLGLGDNRAGGADLARVEQRRQHGAGRGRHVEGEPPGLGLGFGDSRAGGADLAGVEQRRQHGAGRGRCVEGEPQRVHLLRHDLAGCTVHACAHISSQVACQLHSPRMRTHQQPGGLAGWSPS